MLSHFSKIFFVLFIAIVSVIVVSDYFYARFETQKVFDRDIGLLWKSLEEPITSVEKFNNKDQHLISLTELDWPDAQITQLKTQGFLILETSDNLRVFHGYLAPSQQVLISELPTRPAIEYQWFWWILIYGSLAGVISWWLYPLIRDINQLQNAAIEFGKTKNYFPAKLGHSSAVKPIDNALSQMTKRINRLMSLQRDIATYALHDIRTPLSRIRFACELIDAPEASEIKRDIVEEITEVETLLTELLRYAEFEQTRPTMVVRKINLFTFCQDVTARLSAISAIKINNLIAPDIKVYLEDSLFERALLNLVSNCLRYAKENIWISFERQDNKVCVVVEDDGPGIDIDDLQYIRAPFIRKPNLEDDNSDESNSGLGLAIVETICLWHGGEFIVGNSSKYNGARFVIRWNSQTLFSEQKNNQKNLET